MGSIFFRFSPTLEIQVVLGLPGGILTGIKASERACLVGAWDGYLSR